MRKRTFATLSSRGGVRSHDDGGARGPPSQDAAKAGRPQPYSSPGWPSRGTACSTFFFAEPRSLSYAPFAAPLFARAAFASVMERSASATLLAFFAKYAATGSL